MSNLTAPFRPAAEISLDLAIFNYRPISSAELGDLFSALAKDYARATRGRTLMVYELRTGSILATLTDAAAIVGPILKDTAVLTEAVGAIGKFGRKLFGALGRAKEGGGGVFESGRKREGQASAEALLKIAADADAEVKITQTTPDGHKTEISITSNEAIRIREEAATRRLILLPPDSQRLIASDNGGRLSSEDLAQSLLRLTGPSGELSSDAQQAIEAMVDALRDSGFDLALTSLAIALDGRGRSDVADLVRRRAADRDRTAETS